MLSHDSIVIINRSLCIMQCVCKRKKIFPFFLVSLVCVVFYIPALNNTQFCTEMMASSESYSLLQAVTINTTFFSFK